MGCHFSPEAFKEISFGCLKSQIDNGDKSIDWWKGNPLDALAEDYKGFYLRMRNLNVWSNDKAPIVDPSYGGKCCILTDGGCPLDFKDRPKGGRLLIPYYQEVSKNSKLNFQCVSKYRKRQCAIDWMPYHDILQELYDYFKVDSECKSPNVELKYKVALERLSLRA